MDLSEIGYEDERKIELPRVHIRWRTWRLAALKFRITYNARELVTPGLLHLISLLYCHSLNFHILFKSIGNSSSNKVKKKFTKWW